MPPRRKEEGINRGPQEGEDDYILFQLCPHQLGNENKGWEQDFSKKTGFWATPREVYARKYFIIHLSCIKTHKVSGCT